MTRLPEVGLRDRAYDFPAARRATGTEDHSPLGRRHHASRRARTRLRRGEPELINGDTTALRDQVHHGQPRSLGVRAVQLVFGTIVMGIGIALLVYSRLGLAPMDVLHAGAARTFGWTFGGGIIACQAVLLATYLPLRIVPGLGTVLGFLVPAVTVDFLLPQLPQLDALPARLAALALGGALFCLGVAVYLTADLGRMPRDGIMLAVAGRRASSPNPTRRIALTRVGIDVALVAGGVLLLGPSAVLHSGALGVGTLLLAVGSGPLIAVLHRRLSRIAYVPTRTRPQEPVGAGGDE